MFSLAPCCELSRSISFMFCIARFAVPMTPMLSFSFGEIFAHELLAIQNTPALVMADCLRNRRRLNEFIRAFFLSFKYQTSNSRRFFHFDFRLLLLSVQS